MTKTYAKKTQSGSFSAVGMNKYRSAATGVFVEGIAATPKRPTNIEDVADEAVSELKDVLIRLADR